MRWNLALFLFDDARRGSLPIAAAVAVFSGRGGVSARVDRRR